MACQITHPTGKPGGLSLAVLRLDAEPVAYLTPQTGQFLSVDAKVAQTLEAYLYAGDDPVNRIDPSGQAVFMQCATKTGPSEVACDLGRLASIDFPGISATHIVSIVSAGLLGIVPGVPAAAWHAGRSPGGALSKVASVIIGGIVGAAGAGYWAFRNGNTYSAAQFLSDMKGAELTIFLDEYPKGVSGVGNFNTWLDATIGDSQAFQVYESAILSKVIITGDLSGLLLKLSSKALGNL